MAPKPIGPKSNHPEELVPPKWHKYLDVFDPVEVNNLPPHRSDFDCAIKLEDGQTPPKGPLYHLSKDEQQVLFDYVKENLRKGFIHHSMSCLPAHKTMTWKPLPATASSSSSHIYHMINFFTKQAIIDSMA